MNVVRVASQTDFAGWRRSARGLLTNQVPPEAIEWLVGEGGSLFDNEIDEATRTRGSTTPFTVPARFLRLCETVILHRDPQRFALLYRLLWRLRDEPRLLDVSIDPDVARARLMEKAIDRDIHKMHAYVRFRETTTAEGLVYIAWFEPSHYILEAAAPFFVRRFAAMRWSILTPDASAYWDGEELRIGPAAARSDAPDGDVLETLWRSYYASIFNPARLKTATMQAHMPKKYWANLPEAALIPRLVNEATQLTHDMIEAESHAARRRVVKYDTQAGHESAPGTLQSVRDEALRCRACPLWQHATQTVFGAGPADAPVVFVGEQPGDQEDLAGEPFVGPAGRVFDRAIAGAGIPRDAVYVTNAVKHFKFEPRGKRRLHKTPAQQEIEACHGWLERELALVRPRLVVAMGATAVRALTARTASVNALRGRIVPWRNETQMLITVHPASILRAPHTSQDAEYARFVSDLALAAPFVTGDRHLTALSR